MISLECVSGRKWLIILVNDLTAISWLCYLVFMSVSVSNYIYINKKKNPHTFSVTETSGKMLRITFLNINFHNFF